MQWVRSMFAQHAGSLTADVIPVRMAFELFFELFDSRLNQQLTSFPAASRHFQRSAEQRMRGRPVVLSDGSVGLSLMYTRV